MRELTRPVTRRLGELVVRLESRGLRVRFRGRRKSVLIPWSQIVELAADRAAGRVPTGRLFEAASAALTQIHLLDKFPIRKLKALET